MIKKVKKVIIFLVLFVAFAGCGQNSVEINGSQVSIKCVKQFLTTALNDDNWNNKKINAENELEFKTFYISFYTNSINGKTTSVFFSMKPVERSDGNDYWPVIFTVDSRGICNEPSVIFGGESKGDISQYIREGSYTPAFETKITFPKMERPVYPPVVTEDKKKVVSATEAKVLDTMQVCNFAPGQYRIYVRNFRDNSSKTFSLIESSTGKAWEMSLGIEENGIIDAYRLQEVDKQNEYMLDYAAICKEDAVVDKVIQFVQKND